MGKILLVSLLWNVRCWPEAVQTRRTDSHWGQTLGTRERRSADTSKPLCRGTSSSRRACCLPGHSLILAVMESLDVTLLPKTYGCCSRINFPISGSGIHNRSDTRLPAARLAHSRASVGAGKIVMPPSRQEKGVKPISIIPRSRRLDAK